MFAELFFSLLAITIIHLPSPQNTFSSSAYMLVLGHLPLIYCAQLVAIVFGWYLNTTILLHRKILFHGKFFWLRSTVSSAIGEIIFSVIAASIIMTRLTHTWKTHSDFSLVVHLVMWSVLLKIIGSIIFTIPAAITVSLLKKAGIEYEAVKKFSPFYVDSKPQVS